MTGQGCVCAVANNRTTSASVKSCVLTIHGLWTRMAVLLKSMVGFHNFNLRNFTQPTKARHWEKAGHRARAPEPRFQSLGSRVEIYIASPQSRGHYVSKFQPPESQFQG